MVTSTQTTVARPNQVYQLLHRKPYQNSDRQTDQFYLEDPATAAKRRPLHNPDVVCIEDEPGEITECPLCGNFIQTSLDMHFQTDHREYECPFCGHLFNDESSLFSHVNRLHNDDRSGLDSIDHQLEFLCPICKISAASQAALELHVEMHFSADSNNFENNLSSQCGKLTDSTNSLIVNIDDNFANEQTLSEFEPGITNESGKT